MIKLFYDKTMSFFENLCRLLLCEESENGSEGNLAAITGIPAGIFGMCFLSDTKNCGADSEYFCYTQQR